MKFECGDLERALAHPDLMADAHKHLRDCAACRNEYRLWNEISSAAKQLHYEWDSPDLWPNIRKNLPAERATPQRWRPNWKLCASAAAALILVAIAVWRQTAPLREPDEKIALSTISGRDFLTEQALNEVERNETAYRRSIDELSRLAQPKLESAVSSPILVSYREKLLLLDSAISETRTNVAQNRFNVSLQNDLADLYREKRQTLQEILTRAQNN